MKNRSLFIIVGLSTTLLACGEAEKANGHLASMEKTLGDATKHAERMANSLEGFQVMFSQVMQVFNTSFKPKAPAPTDDIDDILNMESGVQKIAGQENTEKESTGQLTTSQQNTENQSTGEQK
jgi:hypothetical protein